CGTRAVLGRRGVADFRERDRPVRRAVEQLLPVPVESVGLAVAERLAALERRGNVEAGGGAGVERGRDDGGRTLRRGLCRDADGEGRHFAPPIVDRAPREKRVGLKLLPLVREIGRGLAAPGPRRRV